MVKKIIFLVLMIFLVGCGSSYQIQLIDASTDLPLARTRIELQAPISCELGVPAKECPEMILFKGTTDFNGMIRVPQYNSYLIIVDNFGLTLVQQDRNNPNLVYLDWPNQAGTDAEHKQFNVPEETVVVKTWPWVEGKI